MGIAFEPLLEVREAEFRKERTVEECEQGEREAGSDPRGITEVLKEQDDADEDADVARRPAQPESSRTCAMRA